MSDNRTVNKEAIERRKARKTDEAKKEAFEEFLGKDFLKVFQDNKGFEFLNGESNTKNRRISIGNIMYDN